MVAGISTGVAMGRKCSEAKGKAGRKARGPRRLGECSVGDPAWLKSKGCGLRVKDKADEVSLVKSKRAEESGIHQETIWVSHTFEARSNRTKVAPEEYSHTVVSRRIWRSEGRDGCSAHLCPQIHTSGAAAANQSQSSSLCPPSPGAVPFWQQ